MMTMMMVLMSFLLNFHFHLIMNVHKDSYGSKALLFQTRDTSMDLVLVFSKHKNLFSVVIMVDLDLMIEFYYIVQLT